MKPRDWKELFHKAHVLAEEFENYLEKGGGHNLWDKRLCELRLGLIFLISPAGTPSAVPREGTTGTAERMRAAKIVIESLERTYSSILAMDFRNRSR